ncbi:glycosyltransferase family 4 protein [Microbacterium keratanolyticum]|uniref:glycosyltransferase family 4 protein n=2 Tax=Microbacterium keratanolyticum TaxID=67574 RepID=UPI00362F7E9A
MSAPADPRHRVWMVNHYATDPTESSSGSRHFSLAKGLARHGWDATIIAASTDHPSGLQRSGMTTTALRRIEGVEFQFLRTPSYPGSAVRRLWNMMSFTQKLLAARFARSRPRPDVIIGSTVHPAAAWAASALSRRWGVPFVFEVRDLWPATLIDMGKLAPNGVIARAMRRLERHLCDRASAIITLLPYAGAYLEDQGVSPEKVIWISNGCAVADFPKVEPSAASPFTFMYLGSIGRANGVDDIIRAFAPLAPSSRLVLYGTGAFESSVRDLARELGIETAVEFRGVVPKARVPEVMREADALVMNVLDLAVYRHGISMNKLFDYMASGLPIVMASSAPNNPVRDSDAGISVPAADQGSFTAAMRRMSESSDEQRRTWGDNGRRHVAEHYDYDVLAEKLASVLTQASQSENVR